MLNIGQLLADDSLAIYSQNREDLTEGRQKENDIKKSVYSSAIDVAKARNFKSKWWFQKPQSYEVSHYLLDLRARFLAEKVQTFLD